MCFAPIQWHSVEEVYRSLATGVQNFQPEYYVDFDAIYLKHSLQAFNWDNSDSPVLDYQRLYLFITDPLVPIPLFLSSVSHMETKKHHVLQVCR